MYLALFCEFIPVGRVFERCGDIVLFSYVLFGTQLDAVRNKVADMSGADVRDVRVVVSPYRICPLGAHIDHQVCFRCFSPHFVDRFVC